jgi:hypothetical protein
MRSTIEMALEAGFQLADKRLYVYDCDGVCQEEVERLVELVRADERSIEREACAKVADEADKYNRHISKEIAAAIRARGETK